MSPPPPMKYLALAMALLLVASMGSAGGADVPLLERDVLPILAKNCMGCHGGLRKKGGLDVRTVPSILAGGDSGPAIVAGKAHESELWKQIENPGLFHLVLGCRFDREDMRRQ